LVSLGIPRSSRKSSHFVFVHVLCSLEATKPSNRLTSSQIVYHLGHGLLPNIRMRMQYSIQPDSFFLALTLHNPNVPKVYGLAAFDLVESLQVDVYRKHRVLVCLWVILFAPNTFWVTRYATICAQVSVVSGRNRGMECFFHALSVQTRSCVFGFQLSCVSSRLLLYCVSSRLLVVVVGSPGPPWAS